MHSTQRGFNIETMGGRWLFCSQMPRPGRVPWALLAVACIAGPPPAMAVEPITCDTGISAASIRFFDGHDHLPEIANAAEGEAELDALALEGVPLGMLALATPNSVANAAALEMQSVSAYPVFAFARAPTVLVGGVKTLDESSLNAVRGQLDAGATGIGEITLRHSGPPALAADIPANHPVAMAIYAEAAARNVPVSIHFELRDKSAPGVDIPARIEEFRAALGGNPDTRFLWAHMGDSGPETVGALLAEFENLYADISTRNPYFVRGWPMALQSLGTGSDGMGGLKPAWKNVFEAHADRIVFGLDLASEDRKDQVSDVMAFYRAMLGEVSAATAERIACKNARALLTTPDLPSARAIGVAVLVLALLAVGYGYLQRTLRNS